MKKLNQYFKLISILLISAALLWGCSKKSETEGQETGAGESSEKTQITFLTPLSGADGAFMDKIIQGFNEENPDVEVTHLVVGASTDFKQKFATGVSTESAPEVLMIRKFDMPLYMNQFMGMSKQELSDMGIDIDDVFPNLLDGLVEDGEYLGIPLDVWIFYMAYNKANFAEAGLDPEDPPYTKEEFISAMEALVPVTPEGITPYYETITWSWIWVHFMWQFGGDLLTEDYSAPAFEEAGVKTLKFMADLQDKGILPRAAVDAGPAFQSGDASCLITGIWSINPWIEAMGDDFGYAVAPQVGNTKAVFGGSHVIALTDVMLQDPKKEEAAKRWVKYLWDHMIDWYAAGQTPSRKSIAESEELKNELPQIYEVAQQLGDVKTFQMYPYISEVLDEIVVYVEACLFTGEMTPEEAMAEASEAVQFILDDYK